MFSQHMPRRPVRKTANVMSRNLRLRRKRARARAASGAGGEAFTLSAAQIDALVDAFFAQLDEPSSPLATEPPKSNPPRSESAMNYSKLIPDRIKLYLLYAAFVAYLTFCSVVIYWRAASEENETAAFLAEYAYEDCRRDGRHANVCEIEAVSLVQSRGRPRAAASDRVKQLRMQELQKASSTTTPSEKGP